MNERLKHTIKRLEEIGDPFRIIDLGEPARRSSDVADRKKELGVDPDQTVKTIMFKSHKIGVFAVALLGKDRIDYKKLKLVVEDKKIRTLHPDEMRELGWEPGECCPLTVPGELFIDESVFEHNTINTGSGDLYYGLEFPITSINRIRKRVHKSFIKE